MPSLDTLALFLVAAVLFTVAPGPAVFYVVTRSMSQGRRSGVTSALAVAVGNLVHVAAAVAGLSALLASSAVAFTVVKYLGAAYLIYLGVRTLRQGTGGAPGASLPPIGLSRIFRQGVVVAILNPKTALFFLAFLPQFIEAGRGAVSVQVAVLGVLVVTVGAVSDSCYALLAGSAGGLLRRSVRLRRGGRLLSGGAYITLGVTAAVVGDRPARAAGTVRFH